MTFKPAHKQDNPALKPGQTVYGFDRYPYLKSGSIAEPSAKPKLTFDEWAASQGYGYFVSPNKFKWTSSQTLDQDEAREIWNAAQENAK